MHLLSAFQFWTEFVSQRKKNRRLFAISLSKHYQCASRKIFECFRKLLLAKRIGYVSRLLFRQKYQLLMERQQISKQCIAINKLRKNLPFHKNKLAVKHNKMRLLSATFGGLLCNYLHALEIDTIAMEKATEHSVIFQHAKCFFQLQYVTQNRRSYRHSWTVAACYKIIASMKAAIVSWSRFVAINTKRIKFDESTHVSKSGVLMLGRKFIYILKLKTLSRLKLSRRIMNIRASPLMIALNIWKAVIDKRLKANSISRYAQNCCRISKKMRAIRTLIL